jgi:hypothetical protein
MLNLSILKKPLLWILLTVVALRIPNLFEPYWYGDEGIYLVLGQAVRNGLVLYRDIHDNKPPILYWLAAVSESQFWFKFMLLIFSLATVALYYKLVKIFFGEKQKIVIFAASLFALLSTIPLVEGNIANAENFIIFFTVGGFLLLFYEQTLLPIRYLAAGFMFAMATLLKVPAGPDFVTAILLLLLFKTEKGDLKKVFKSLFYLFLGFSLPILVIGFYYFLRGAFSQFIIAALLQNFGYLGSWQTGSHQATSLPYPLIFRGLIWFIIIGLIWLLRKKFSLIFSFSVLWFASSLFGATLSGRPYGHYLLTVVPPLVLLLANLFYKVTSWEKRFTYSLLIILFASLAYFRFWFYPVFGYYGNFLDFAVGIKTQSAYFAWFGGDKVNRNYEIANYVTNHTLPTDKIFVWGDEPFIYALSRRLPAGRYTVAYHIIDFRGAEETSKTILKEKPKLIILTKSEKENFPQLTLIIGEYYQLITKIGDAQIFLLR